MNIKTKILQAALAIAFSSGASGVQAASTTDNNFTMLNTDGVVIGGTNDVAATWDGLYESSVSSTNFSHMSLSSTTPFFAYNWTTHHIRVFGPGTYTIDTTCTVAQMEAGVSVCNNPLAIGQTQQHYTFTVGADQIGGHMLFDWNTSTNIDIVDVWSTNAVFGPSAMHTGASGGNPANTVWALMSTDWDGDGINGVKMIDGPFINFSANYNLNAVPIPAAFWLIGSGLIGLFGFLRRHHAQ